MTDRFKGALEGLINANEMVATDRYEHMAEHGIWARRHQLLLQEALTLATESEQLRKRLAELETALEQANNKIQWYERTEAKND